VISSYIVMAKQTYFDQTWLTCDRYSKYHSWLGACDDRTSFRCHVCLKTLKLSNMGIEAIKSHSENQKHLRLVAQQSAGVTPSVVSFFKSSKSSRQVLSFSHFTTLTLEAETASNIGTYFLLHYITGSQNFVVEWYIIAILHQEISQGKWFIWDWKVREKSGKMISAK